MPKQTMPSSAGQPPKSNLPPAVALAFVIIALLGVLIVMVLKNGLPEIRHRPRTSRRFRRRPTRCAAEYNNQRIAMGLRPDRGHSEPIEEIAGRMKKDADSLVALAGSYQKLLAEKDNELTARNAEILRSEKLRAALSAENARLQGDLQRALVGGSDIDLLRRDLTDVKAQRDALAAELKERPRENATMSAGVSPKTTPTSSAASRRRCAPRSFSKPASRIWKAISRRPGSSPVRKTSCCPPPSSCSAACASLEGKPDSEIASAYSSLGVKLGANVLKTLNFATGSSVLTPAG